MNIRPAGVGLLFRSRAEIAAAPAAEREAYFRIVDGIVANPEAYGLRRDNAADAQADETIDRKLAAMNRDLVS